MKRPIRSATWTMCRTSRAPRRSRSRSRTPSALAARMRRWSFVNGRSAICPRPSLRSRPRSRAGWMSNRMQQQPDSNACFVCGRDNPCGLKLDFYEVDGRVETTFTPRPEHQGWPGFLHGGILYTVLDETIGRVGFTMDAYVMSGRVEIRYRQPAPIDA